MCIQITNIEGSLGIITLGEEVRLNVAGMGETQGKSICENKHSQITY